MKNILLLVSIMLTVSSYVFASTEYEIRKQIERGGSVIIGSEFSEYAIKGFITLGKNRVTVKCNGFSASTCNRFVQLGANAHLSAELTGSSVLKILQSKTPAALITVLAIGFSESDLRKFATLGAIIDRQNSVSTTSEIIRQLESGGSIIVTNNYRPSDIERFIAIGKSRVTVKCDNFNENDCKRFIELGAQVIIENTFSEITLNKFASLGKFRIMIHCDRFSAYSCQKFVEKGSGATLSAIYTDYEIRKILSAKISPAILKIISKGFSDYELKSFAQLGATIVH